MALAELDFVNRYTDMPAGLLTDNTRRDRLVGDRTHLTPEEQKLRDLRKELARRGRDLRFFGLTRPDIVAYLPEESLREESTNFPQWQTIIRAWRQKQSPPPFKRFVKEQTGLNLTDMDLIRQLIQRMRERGIGPLPELVRMVAEITAVAGGGRSLNVPT